MKFITNMRHGRPAIATSLLPEKIALGLHVFSETQAFDFVIGVGGDKVEDEGCSTIDISMARSVSSSRIMRGILQPAISVILLSRRIRYARASRLKSNPLRKNFTAERCTVAKTFPSAAQKA
jgi:hypothetical protein